VLHAAGRPKEAEVLAQLAAKHRTAQLGPSHPDTLESDIFHKRLQQALLENQAGSSDVGTEEAEDGDALTDVSVRRLRVIPRRPDLETSASGAGEQDSPAPPEKELSGTGSIGTMTRDTEASAAPAGASLDAEPCSHEPTDYSSSSWTSRLWRPLVPPASRTADYMILRPWETPPLLGESSADVDPPPKEGCGSCFYASLVSALGIGIIAALVTWSVLLQAQSQGGLAQHFWPPSRRGSATGSNRSWPSALRHKPGLVGQHELLCNASALAPGPWAGTSHHWRLEDNVWLDLCETKNRQRDYPSPSGRNWCWVGMKRQCHKSITHHKSWATIQDDAAELGLVPPRRQEPFAPLAAPDVCDRPEYGESRDWTREERREARTWFEKNVAVYVVNLRVNLGRWTMVSSRLEVLGINATRVPGVDMRESDALEKAKQAGWVPQGFSFEKVQAEAYSDDFHMGSVLGTLGCAAAHFKVLATIRKDGPPLAVVFEDDSWPEADFVERLWSLVREELPCDWEVTSLMSRCPYGHCVSRHLARVQPDVNEPESGCRHGVNWGMHGILYRTSALGRLRKVWGDTVFNEERPRCLDVDVALASISDRLSFYAVPSVQKPGFLKESRHESVRTVINVGAATTSTDKPHAGPVVIGRPWMQ
jgi:hypothetical protein